MDGHKEKKCAIINYWWADGHGAALTAFALSTLLTEYGFQPCLIKTAGKNDEKICEEGRNFRFIEQNIKCTYKNYVSYNDFKKLNDEYENFILGSDQVFRLEWIPDEWFYNAIDYKKNIIAIAASFGINKVNNSKSRIKGVARYLRRFNAISLRELDGIEVYKKYFGFRENIEVILDPVFLIKRKEYDQLIMKNEDLLRSETGNIIFFYVLDVNEEIKELAQKLAKQYAAKVIWETPNLSIESFLYYVQKCKLVITDSFHGTCFAIIYNKPFYCVYNELRGTSRIDSLKEVLQIKEQVFIKYGHLAEQEYAVPDINYKEINDILCKEKRKSIDWIIKNLKSPVSKSKKSNLLDRMEVLSIRYTNKVVGKYLKLKKGIQQRRKNE